MYNYNYLDNYNFVNSNIMPLNNDIKENTQPINIPIKEERDINTNNLYTPSVTYMNGNMFSNLYEPYKNYNPTVLTPKTEQQQLFLELSQMQFSAHEINLYLDLHPEDNTMLTLFNDYRKKAVELMQVYENKFGPLTLSSNSLNTSPFLWESQTWPFEQEGVSSV